MAVEKFTFDRQFDAPPPAPPEPVLEDIVPEEPPPPPPPTFSEAELEGARAVARAEGLTEGLRQGRAEALGGIEQAQLQITQSVDTRLGDILSSAAECYAKQRSLSLQIALTITAKLLPDYIARHGQGEIEALVSRILNDLIKEPHLAIRVADAQLDYVRQTVEAMAAQRGFAGKLVFMAEPQMGVSDCRIEWADGGAERDEARLWAEVDRLVAQVRQTLPEVSLPSVAPAVETTTRIES